MRRLQAALAITAAGSLALPAQDIVLPDGKAKNIVQHTCTECHGLEEIVTNPMSRDKWKATVARMVSKGASLDSSQIDTVVDYLSVYFAPDKVSVNTASAKELQDALGISEVEAKAVVEARGKTKIDSVEALARAAGVDAKKLEAKKDLVIF